MDKLTKKGDSKMMDCSAKDKKAVFGLLIASLEVNTLMYQLITPTRDINKPEASRVRSGRPG